MEGLEVGGLRVLVASTLDGTPGGILDGAILIEDTGDADLNKALARAILRAARAHDRGPTF